MVRGVGMKSKRVITLKVSRGLFEDKGKGIARLDHFDMQELGLEPGSVVEVLGGRQTVAKILPSFAELSGSGLIQMDGLIRENAQASLDDEVKVRPCRVQAAKSILLTPEKIIEGDPTPEYLSFLRKRLSGIVCLRGDKVVLTMTGDKMARFTIEGANPSGAVLITGDTEIKIKDPEVPVTACSETTYEDIGGLSQELRLVREVIELPLKYPFVFHQLGIDAPKGILLYGPPGTGKTLIARAVARENDTYFIHVNGPEIMHKYYGESEARLREVFTEAHNNAPSIIFIDEIDALAPRRSEVYGDVEKRVVGQLLALMDGLESRKEVTVLAATNLPEMIDPALRRPGRFDREIAINVPDREGRLEILKIHTRAMSMNGDVDLEDLARVTHGFVGADLAALCREAGMCSLRRSLPELRLASEGKLHLKVDVQDFKEALAKVEPSATREFYVEVPSVSWDDVGGLGDIKIYLESLVEWPLKYSDLFQKFQLDNPSGILLSGPPGTGKTMVIKALAQSSGLNFISIGGRALRSRWAGEAEGALHSLFRKAKQVAPCILFLDEIDAMASSRSSNGMPGYLGERLLSQLLLELSGMEALGAVVIIAATNRIDRIDPALLRSGRFDEIIEFSAPDCHQREEIFRVCLRSKPLQGLIRFQELARDTEGLVGADIAAVCRRAALLVITGVVANRERNGILPEGYGIREEHLRQALAERKGRAGY